MIPNIFISYRREDGEMTAKAIAQDLIARGYKVFYDHDTLKGGNFEDAIRKSIQGCKDFILIVSPKVFDRCNDPHDFVRLEIREALQAGKNIIPVWVNGGNFDHHIPYDIHGITKLNAVRLDMDYYKAAMDKLCSFLSARSGVSVNKAKAKRGVAVFFALLLAAALIAGLLFFTSFGKRLLCSHDYRTEVVSPTCTEGGYTLKECTKCGKTNKTDLVNPYGHSFGETIYQVTPTCTTGGRGTVTCEVCNHSENKTLPATGHAFEAWIYDSEASATENGHRHRSCTACEHYEEEIVYATGSIGLSFTKVGSAYTVSGIGSCSDEAVIIPASVEGVPVTAINKNAFKDCVLITSVTIPESVTVIGKNAFKGCAALETVTLPTKMTEIGEYAFADCVSLTEITIPAGITLIPTRAFNDCSSLRSVYIPKSVTKLGAYSFNGCRSLEAIHYEGTKVLWRNNISLGGGCYQNTSKFTIYCSDGEISKMDWEGIFE